MLDIAILMGYWLVFFLKPPLWKIMDFVSWDDEIPNWMESHNPFMFQTTNQANFVCLGPHSLKYHSQISYYVLHLSHKKSPVSPVSKLSINSPTLSLPWKSTNILMESMKHVLYIYSYVHTHCYYYCHYCHYYCHYYYIDIIYIYISIIFILYVIY